MSERCYKFVNDLGVAAYLLMHGFTVVGKKGKAIYFELTTEDEAAEFDNVVLDYQPPNEFYTFDSCLMFLKKINEYVPSNLENTPHKVVSDLGVAAYILTKEYDRETCLGTRVIGKRGRDVFFACPEEKSERFERLTYQYLPSQFQNYDSNLMALKKLGEFFPKG